MSFEIVAQMKADQPILQGTTIICLPGGKQGLNVQVADSGACHASVVPTGLTATQAVASGANTNWGRSGEIAAYPQYYSA